MKRELTCVLCPRGCHLTAITSGKTASVSGNGCLRGVAYAESECFHPMRTVTATVRVANRPDTMVSVKTETPIPKAHMADVMRLLRKISVQAPVHLGDVLLTDAYGSRILITKAVR